MPLGMEVGLRPGDVVLDGDPAPSPKRGGAPNFRPTSVVAQWLHGSRCQFYGGSPRPMRHCVRCGTAPQLSASVRCGQTAGWTKMPLVVEVGLGPGKFVCDGTQLSPEKGAHQHPNFRPMSVVAKWLDGSRCHLVRR